MQEYTDYNCNKYIQYYINTGAIRKWEVRRINTTVI